MPHSDLSKPELAETAGRVAGILYRTNFLASVERDTAISLIQQGILITAETGDVLGRYGDGPDFVMVLLEGEVSIRSGKRTIGRMDRRGDVIGELGVLGFGDVHAEVIAESHVEAFAITTDSLGQEEFVTPAANLYQSLSYSLANCIRTLSIEINGRPDRTPGGSGIDIGTGLAAPARLKEILGALTSAQNGLAFSIVLVGINPGAKLDSAQLAHLGDTLRHSIRHDDLAARLDADNFVIVLPNCNAFNARSVASELQGSVLRALGAEVPVSFAAATHSGEGNAETLLERAKAALAKCDGSVVSAE